MIHTSHSRQHEDGYGEDFKIKAREILAMDGLFTTTRMYRAAIDNACNHIYKYYYTRNCGEIKIFHRKLDLNNSKLTKLRDCSKCGDISKCNLKTKETPIKFRKIGAKEYNRRNPLSYKEFEEEYMTEDGDNNWPFKKGQKDMIYSSFQEINNWF